MMNGYPAGRKSLVIVNYVQPEQEFQLNKKPNLNPNEKAMGNSLPKVENP